MEADTLSFYPHLAFPLFTRRHCTLSSPLFCVIKLVRGFSSFKCSCFYFKAVQETIKWNNNSCNSIPLFVLNLLFSLSKGRWEGQAQWHTDDKEIMQMLGVRDVHRLFLSWGKCQKEWFEYSLTWNGWRKCLWENFEWHISNVWPGLQTGYYYLCWEAISPYEVMGGIQWLIVSRILYRSNYTEMEKKTEKNREKKEGRGHVPLGQHVRHRKSVSTKPACHKATLLLQASLSPDGWCVGLLMVKGDIKWTTCVSTCVSAHSSQQRRAVQEQKSQQGCWVKRKKCAFIDIFGSFKGLLLVNSSF